MNKLNKDKYIARGWKNENKRFKRIYEKRRNRSQIIKGENKK